MCSTPRKKVPDLSLTDSCTLTNCILSSSSSSLHPISSMISSIVSYQCQQGVGHKLSYQYQQGHMLLIDQCQTNWHDQQPMSTQTQELHQCQTNGIMFQPGRNYSQHCNELTIIFGLLIKEKVLIDVIPSYCLTYLSNHNMSLTELYLCLSMFMSMG